MVVGGVLPDLQVHIATFKITYGTMGVVNGINYFVGWDWSELTRWIRRSGGRFSEIRRRLHIFFV